MSDTSWSTTITNQKYAHDLPEGRKETWEEIAYRVTLSVLGAVGLGPETTAFGEIFLLIRDKIFMPGGRYLYASGRPFHQTQNCLLLRAEDSREGWADLLYKSTMALMTGAGIGVDYSDVRPRGSLITRTGGLATGPIELMKALNEIGRGVMQGGSRRSAIWAGLRWSHKDVFEFARIKDWPEHIRAAKAADFNAYAPMDMTNVSIVLDRDFFDAYGDSNSEMHDHAHKIYWLVIRQMLETAEPGFSVDYDNKRESLRNACTEITSEDDSDICNLGSINMAKIKTKEDMRHAVRYATLFLMSGTIYSDLPYAKVAETRTKNRRLGLGLMGLHEWLLVRGKKYGPDTELGEYLDIYTESSKVANAIADEWGVSRPIKTRACAPTGTIGIVAKTSTGIEPIFCVALIRRWLVGSEWNQKYVIDETAKRLIDTGIRPDDIEDAYTLAEDVERRVQFQAWMQGYVDHGISSTINLPPWGSPLNNEDRVDNFGNMLLKYLPKLRGITVYPDGARSGQPLTRVPYEEAARALGVVYESQDICDLTKAGSCGS